MIKIATFQLAILVIAFLLSSNAYSQTCPASPGCLDPTFGNGGTIIYQNTTLNSVPIGLASQSDGKLVALVIGDNKLMRMNADGSLDPSFGAGGTVSISWVFTSGSTTYLGQAWALAIQNVAGQERIVVVGMGHLANGRKVDQVLRVGRFLPDGSVDTTFGSSGSVIINSGWSPDVAIQTDGKIVTGPATLVRLNVNGTQDSTFGNGGFINTGLGTALTIDANGRILTGGGITIGKGNNTKSVMAVKRYSSNGAVDAAFGVSGLATADFGNSSVGGQLRVDALGNIFETGHVNVSANNADTQHYFAAARFTSNGLADTSFGGTGRVRFVGPIGVGSESVLQTDGKIVIIGRLNNDYGLVRYNYDGTVDTGFGNGGSVITHVDGNDNVRSSMLHNDPACACYKILVGAGGDGTNTSFARFVIE